MVNDIGHSTGKDVNIPGLAWQQANFLTKNERARFF